MARNTPLTLNQAEVAGALSGYFGVPPGHPGVVKLMELVMPDVQVVMRRHPTSWKSELPGVIARYESAARELGLGVSQTRRDAELLRRANETDATFAGIVNRLGHNGLDTLRIADTGRRFDGLSKESRVSTDAASFGQEIGLRAADYSLVVGTSSAMRDAIRDFIKNGRAINDDDVKNLGDVQAVIGLVRAGKLSADDPRIPSSVRTIIAQMKKDGIDPAAADAKTIQKYFKDHPDALKAAKEQDRLDKKSAAGMTDEQKRAKIQEKPKTVAATTAAAKAAAPSTTM